MYDLTPTPLTATAFAAFGDVLDAEGTPDKMINDGLCARYHDRALLQTDPAGRSGLSIFQAQARALPYMFDLVERHPKGSQAFVPMHQHPFLVIIAPDHDGIPGPPHAFLTAPGQGINLHQGIWHGVLTPLAHPGLFAVIDRIGPGANLQEYRYDHPWRVCAP